MVDYLFPLGFHLGSSGRTFFAPCLFRPGKWAGIGRKYTGIALGADWLPLLPFYFCVCLMPSACFPRSLFTPHTLIPVSESVQACGVFWIYCWQCKTITRVNFWISFTKILVCRVIHFKCALLPCGIYPGLLTTLGLHCEEAENVSGTKFQNWTM